MKRLEAGIFGDCKPVGDDVLELREHLGAGYRVYFGRHALSIVILLCGGSKRTQATDIKLTPIGARAPATSCGAELLDDIQIQANWQSN